ncbi:MAG: FecR domain-containing protein [Bacteroidia bacterium]|nr:FecR domain-containing protein [Bacteroidia bacterium]
MDDQLINNVIAKSFSGEDLTVDENNFLRQWKINNEEEYHRLQSFWNSNNAVLDSSKTDFSVDVEEAWKSVSSKLVQNKTVPLQRNRFKWIAVAASICLLIGTSVWFSLSYDPSVMINSGDEVSKKVTLADGSVVTLNKNSSIEYRRKMKAGRNVKLTGEAFFEVTHDEKHPFVVKTDNAQVKVLGTSFNVKTNSLSTTVNVKTGKVELNREEKSIILLAGEMGYTSKEEALKKHVNNENYLAWKNKKMVFNEATLAEVVRDLANYYNTFITIKGNADNCRVTTVFTSETLIEALDELKVLLHFDYKKTENEVTIYNIECS